MTSYGSQILPVCRQRDVPLAYRDTAIADLLAYHNLLTPHRPHFHAEMLVGMCMDHRMWLRIPKGFAYVMRTAGANLRGLEFQMSSAIAVGGVGAIAIIGHDQCSMYGLTEQREAFVTGLIGAGWERHVAEQHFEDSAPLFETGDAVGFVRAQALHVRQQYPALTVAPLFYKLDDGSLYVIDESEETNAKRGSMKLPIRAPAVVEQ